ncbi:MAG: signal recognition particle-docking protein FtsY [Gammaproteobacteria bacterium]|nr:signal recognition particle-docking protein FtsY [Gammaproteobacteria bacterium]
MINWLKKKQTSAQQEADLALQDTTETAVAPETTPKTDFFSRFKQSLRKTRHQLGDGIGQLLRGKKELDIDVLEEIEASLLSADLGMGMTQAIIQDLTAGMQRKELANGEAALTLLKTKLKTVLSACVKPIEVHPQDAAPFVVLMVGVNGAGKTTTIGKLAKMFQQQDKKVMLAAGDTFRAAAVEQLQAWGERNHIPVIAQHTGADSASVIFDAFQAAKARNADILIADTAGRLHTQDNLMAELQKVKRVLQKIDPNAPHEIMLVLDAGVGQNALNQARQFDEAVGLTGITMTKLDGTAKGGILFALAHEMGLPFRYIGVGEGIDDLRPFDADQFVDAIFDDQL